MSLWSYGVNAGAEAATRSFERTVEVRSPPGPLGLTLTSSSDGHQRGVRVAALSPDSPLLSHGVCVGWQLVGIDGKPAVDANDAAARLQQCADRPRIIRFAAYDSGSVLRLRALIIVLLGVLVYGAFQYLSIRSQQPRVSNI